MVTCAVACEARTATANARYISIELDVVGMAAGEANLRRPSRPPRSSSSVRRDGVLRPASERMKLSHCPRELPWLLGPRIPGTFHLNKKECDRRNELSLDRPRHFAASSRRRSSRNKN